MRQENNTVDITLRQEVKNYKMAGHAVIDNGQPGQPAACVVTIDWVEGQLTERVETAERAAELSSIHQDIAMGLAKFVQLKEKTRRAIASTEPKPGKATVIKEGR